MLNPRATAGHGGSGSVVSWQLDWTHDTAFPPVPEQLRRRRAASWRCAPLAVDGRRDPFDPITPPGWTGREVASWDTAARHLQACGLFGQWQVPQSVRAPSWRRRAGDAA
jgi:hypothetical protein